MDVTTILIILLAGAFATYFAGDKWASKIALLFSLVAFGGSICLLNHCCTGIDINYSALWISKPKVYFALQAMDWH